MIITVESIDQPVDDVATLNLKVTSGNVSATVEIIIRSDHADRLIETIEVVKQAADSLEPGPTAHELLSTRHGDRYNKNKILFCDSCRTALKQVKEAYDEDVRAGLR